MSRPASSRIPLRARARSPSPGALAIGVLGCVCACATAPGKTLRYELLPETAAAAAVDAAMAALVADARPRAGQRERPAHLVLPAHPDAGGGRTDLLLWAQSRESGESVHHVEILWKNVAGAGRGARYRRVGIVRQTDGTGPASILGAEIWRGDDPRAGAPGALVAVSKRAGERGIYRVRATGGGRAGLAVAGSGGNLYRLVDCAPADEADCLAVYGATPFAAYEHMLAEAAAAADASRFHALDDGLRLVPHLATRPEMRRLDDLRALSREARAKDGSAADRRRQALARRWQTSGIFDAVAEAARRHGGERAGWAKTVDDAAWAALRARAIAEAGRAAAVGRVTTAAVLEAVAARLPRAAGTESDGAPTAGGSAALAALLGEVVPAVKPATTAQAEVVRALYRDNILLAGLRAADWLGARTAEPERYARPHLVPVALSAAVADDVGPELRAAFARNLESRIAAMAKAPWAAADRDAEVAWTRALFAAHGGGVPAPIDLAIFLGRRDPAAHAAPSPGRGRPAFPPPANFTPPGRMPRQDPPRDPATGDAAWERTLCRGLCAAENDHACAALGRLALTAPRSPELAAWAVRHGCRAPSGAGCAGLGEMLLAGAGMSKKIEAGRWLLAGSCDAKVPAACRVLAAALRREKAPAEHAAAFEDAACRLGDDGACEALDAHYSVASPPPGR